MHASTTTTTQQQSSKRYKNSGRRFPSFQQGKTTSAPTVEAGDISPVSAFITNAINATAKHQDTTRKTVRFDQKSIIHKQKVIFSKHHRRNLQTRMPQKVQVIEQLLSYSHLYNQEGSRFSLPLVTATIPPHPLHIQLIAGLRGLSTVCQQLEVLQESSAAVLDFEERVRYDSLQTHLGQEVVLSKSLPLHHTHRNWEKKLTLWYNKRISLVRSRHLTISSTIWSDRVIVRVQFSSFENPKVIASIPIEPCPIFLSHFT